MLIQQLLATTSLQTWNTCTKEEPSKMSNMPKRQQIIIDALQTLTPFKALQRYAKLSESLYPQPLTFKN